MSTDDMDKKHRAVKVTITFADGHTEDFDTFMASVAYGLIPAGKDEEDGTPFYMAEKGRFQSRSIVHVAASADVLVGLINAFLSTMTSLFKDIGPEEALKLLEAFDSMGHSVAERYGSTRTKRIDPKTN